MYVRVTRVQNTPERLEATITGFRQEVVPALQKLPGNLGAALLANRETGAAAGVTYWETKNALTASEAVAGTLRAQHVVPTGAMVIETAQYELIAQYRTASPAANTFVRLNTVEAEAEVIDALLTFAQDTAMPAVKSAPGLRALLLGVDRENNRCILSSVWSTAADREASEARVTDLRRVMAEIAGAEVNVELLETVFAEVRLPAATGG